MVASPSEPRESRHPVAESERPATGFVRTLTWQQLVGLIFFAVCGGDYGIEDAVGAGGPALTLLGLLIVPWLWSLPIALMTAELGSMIPEAGGPVVWIERAFGPFWAHQNAMWRVVQEVFDNALYPVMFADYLRAVPALDVEGPRRWLVSAAMLAVVTSLNLLGVDVVADVSNIFTAIVISPFAVLVIAGVPKMTPSAWLIGPSQPMGHLEWGAFVAVLLWNTSGHDTVGALAAEVHEPAKSFPRALNVANVLITLVYLLPVAVGVALDNDRDVLATWTDGSFTRVAEEHIGEWLGLWISVGGAISSFGLLNTLLCCAARFAVSAAKLGVLPRALASVHPSSGVPRTATVVISLVLAMAIVLPFAELVEIAMLFYGACTLLLFLALIALRRTEPHTPRPYRVPLGDVGLAVAFTPAMLMCLLLIYLAPRGAWLLFAMSVALGCGTYCVRDDSTKRAAGGHSDLM